MATRGFDAQLAALESLREAAPEAAVPQLAKALDFRNNFLVAKAAAITLHHRLTSLATNLAAAFPRFLENGAETDPQCWAKNAIVKALASFEYQDPQLFLAGIRHIQLEPSWGGATDSAGPLRGACALALVQCREVNSHRLLIHLVPLLADTDLTVRVNAVRAIEQIGTDSAALLLRLRAELGAKPEIFSNEEPEVLGSCFSGVLALEGATAVPWVTQFLAGEDDAAVEAALAIAQTHTPEAFELLRSTYSRARGPQFRADLLSAIALTRQQQATDWLLDMIAGNKIGSADAHTALCRSAPSEATLERLRKLNKPCPSK